MFLTEVVRHLEKIRRRIVIISGVVFVVEVVIRMSSFASSKGKGFSNEVVLYTSRRVCVF